MPSESDNRLPIPRIFHRVWLGGYPMPTEFERLGRTWLELNPGWEMRTWTEANLPTLRNQREFDRSAQLAQRAAIARYEILELHGGLYIDTDFQCLRNIEPILSGASFVAGWQDTRVINNGLIGATPHHPILREVILRIPYRVATRQDESIITQSGVAFFTEVASSYGASDPLVVLHEPALIYPYHWLEPGRRHESFPEAYAVHHWEASWVAR